MRFGNPITLDTLRVFNLTDEQKAEIQVALNKRADSTLAMQVANPQSMTPEERQAMQEAGQKAAEEFFAAVMNVLTDEQKAKAEELMKDVPQFLQRLVPGPGGPRGSGGPGGGPGGPRGQGGSGGPGGPQAPPM